MNRIRPSRPSRPFPTIGLLVALAAALTVSTPAVTVAQEAGEATAPPPLTLQEVRIEPTGSGEEVLCRLFVKLHNAGDQTASQLGFTVEVSGQELPVYRNQLFMFPVAAGETEELRLYNFWSAETGRPAPADGELTVEVTLNEAVWMEIGMEDEVEVWTPGEAVPGLPVSATATVELGEE